MAMIQSRHAEKPPEHRKHGGSILVLHPVIPVHIPLGLAGMTSAKIQILPGTPSENVSCSWRDPDHTCSCDHFSARACISSRKAAEAAALQKAQEEEAAKRQKKKLLL